MPNNIQEAGSNRKGPGAIAAVVFFYVLSIPLRDLWYPDEPDVARVIQEMLHSGNWLQPTLLDADFASYPPLFYWLAGFFSQAGQLTEFFLRLPSVLAAAVLLTVTWMWTRQRLGAPTGLWAVLVLGSTYLFFQQAVHAHVDMLFAACFGTAVIAFDGFRRSGGGIAPAGWVVCSLAMGLAAIAKSPVGILLPGAILTLDILMRRRWHDLLPLMCCGVAASGLFWGWSLLYAMAAGSDSLWHFLWQQNIGRFTDASSHRQPFYYYAINLPADAMPWTPFLVLALFWVRRQGRYRRPELRLLLLWLGVGLLFFTLASSKRSVYLLPLYPAIAVLVGAFVTHPQGIWAYVKGNRVSLMLLSGLFGLAGLGLVLGCLGFGKELALGLWGYASVMAISALLLLSGSCFWLWRQGRQQQAVRLLPVISLLVLTGVYGGLFPCLDQPLSARADAQWLIKHTQARPHSPIGAFSPEQDILKESTALAFYGPFAINTLHTPADIKQYWQQHPQQPLLVKADDKAAFKQRTAMPFKILKTLQVGSDGILVLLHTTP